MKTLYQLKAVGVIGHFAGSGKQTRFSYRVFTDPEVAKSFIPAFKAKCSGGELFDLDPETVQVSVVELELDETEPGSVEPAGE